MNKLSHIVTCVGLASCVMVGSLAGAQNSGLDPDTGQDQRQLKGLDLSTDEYTSNSSALPELGDASSQFLSRQQEADIGKSFLRYLLAQKNYIDDPYLRYFLNDMGNRIGANASLGGLELEFNLLEENELNAFAVPGGYITFNSGLMLTTETESELASVVGHEIAHLSQRHLPRLIAKQEATKLPTTAAILASILIGGQAGIAGVALTQANALSNQLAYSREFEREADAIGLKLMARSNYDPTAMSSFFDKLQRFSIVSNRDVPEFLRTHPLSYTRVAEAEARQASLPKQPVASSLNFLLARARIGALYAGRAQDALTQFREDLVDDRGKLTDDERDALRYGTALAESKLRRSDQARETLEELLSRHPDHPVISAALAEVLAGQGLHEQAAEQLHDTSVANPDQQWLAHLYLDALIESNNGAEARKVARYELRRNPGDFRLYPKLSEANVALGELALAHQADAEYYAAIGNYREAVTSLRLALRENDGKSDYLTKAAEARVTELEVLRLDSENRSKN